MTEASEVSISRGPNQPFLREISNNGFPKGWVVTAMQHMSGKVWGVGAENDEHRIAVRLRPQDTPEDGVEALKAHVRML